MGPKPGDDFSGGQFAGPIITGGKTGPVSGGTFNHGPGGNNAETTAKLLELLRQLRAEIKAADAPGADRQAVVTMVDQLTEGIDPAQPADADPGRLRGLFAGIEALVPPLAVVTQLVSQIGTLLGTLFG
ncbi:MAG: hypothetical protein ACRDQ5_21960 [Sciscionella sp.]